MPNIEVFLLVLCFFFDECGPAIMKMVDEQLGGREKKITKGTEI